jgi:hypothetical protein
MTARDVFGLVLRIAGLGLVVVGISGGAFVLLALVGLARRTPGDDPLISVVGAFYWFLIGLVLLARAEWIVRAIYGSGRDDPA